MKQGRRTMPDPAMASESERIIGLYQRHATNWDRDRGRDLFEKPWLDRFLALMPPGASVLDIGCGAGEPIARYLTETGCQLTGIDSSPALIGMCKDRFPDQEWVIADMRGFSLDRRFDGVLEWDSFFHLSPEDRRRMFPIFRRHARQQAALMFTSGPSYVTVKRFNSCCPGFSGARRHRETELSVRTHRSRGYGCSTADPCIALEHDPS
jgi:SAM-dependent methyltransferase